MTRLRICRSISLLALLTIVAPAPAQNWTGAANDGGNWNNAANWTNPATVPNSTTADAVFGNTGAGSISLLSIVSVRSLTFNNSAGSYTIGSSSATMNSVTNIAVGAADGGTQTINLANIAAGSLLFSSGANLTISNNASQSLGTTLVIGPSTVIGTPGTGGVTFTGTGSTVMSGSFASGADPVFGGLTKAGPGTLTLSGAGTNLSGGLTLAGGTLKMDFSTNTAAKIGSGSLTSTGGTLNLIPNGSAAVSQNFSSTAFLGGDTEYSVNSGATPTLGLGAETARPAPRSASRPAHHRSARARETPTASGATALHSPLRAGTGSPTAAAS